MLNLYPPLGLRERRGEGRRVTRVKANERGKERIEYLLSLFSLYELNGRLSYYFMSLSVLYLSITILRTGYFIQLKKSSKLVCLPSVLVHFLMEKRLIF